MARIFISHSSADNADAIALRDWLASEGWDDVFLDLDPDRGIVAGERWERSLNEAASRCEAVLFLVSRAWLNSRWCLKELNLGHRLNKRLFGVLIEDVPIAEIPPDLTNAWQLVNLAAGSDHQLFRAVTPNKAEEVHVTFSKDGLKRLKGGLTKAGLDARFFDWPPADEPNRPPYRGLRPLEAEDAGIFFGREAPIIEALDRLRGLSEAAPPRFLVILGASGAGKSSFLRAGLLPRLSRDDRNFLPLPILRPDRAVLIGDTGFLRSLDVAFQAQGERHTRAEIKAALDGGAQSLMQLLASLGEGARPPALPDMPAPYPPALVLSIDQGEELFLAEGADEAEEFLVLLKDLAMSQAPSVIILVAIRSDSYERLQMAKALEGIKQETMSLPPVPHGSYADIIEGPARRLKDTLRALKIEPSLTQALLTDIEAGGAKDALPLLAFTLERLYVEYGGDGDLRLSEYEQLGRVKGSIEAAVERALAAASTDPKTPKDRATQLALLRRGLIPWLAGIDPDTGIARRRVARLSEIPEETRPLVQVLVEQRLLATDVAKGTGEVTIEPAHEALLRQWGLLQTWLLEDSAVLTAVESVKRAARDWEANGKDGSWLIHGGGRLEDAECLRLRPDLAGLLGEADWTYLAACRTRETKEKQREEERRKRELRRNRIIASGSLAGLAIVSVLSLWGWVEQRSSRSREFAMTALDQLKSDAILSDEIALEALKTWNTPQAVSALRQALQESSYEIAEFGRKDKASPVVTAQYSADGKRVLIVSEDGEIRLWDSAALLQPVASFTHKGTLRAAALSNDARYILSAADSGGEGGQKKTGTVHVWDTTLQTGNPVASFERLAENIYAAAMSPDGKIAVITGSHCTARLWRWTEKDREPATLEGDPGDHECPSQKTVAKECHANPDWGPFGSGTWVFAAAFSPDGRVFATGGGDCLVRIWDVATGQPLRILTGHTREVTHLMFSPDGRYLISATGLHGVLGEPPPWIWDTSTWQGQPLAGFVWPRWDEIFAVAVSPDSQFIAATYGDGSARVWNAKSRQPWTELRGHRHWVSGAAFDPFDGRILTTSSDTTAIVWDLGAEPNNSRELLTLGGGTREEFVTVVFSPTIRDQVVTASTDGAAQLWDLNLGIYLEKLPNDLAKEGRGRVSSDGRFTLTIADRDVNIHDNGDERDLPPLHGHTQGVQNAVFSSDGKLIVTAGGDDNTARIWDTISHNEPIAILRGHNGSVRDAEFDATGTFVVTAGFDETVRVWDVATGQNLATFIGRGEHFSRASFGQDNAFIVAWGQNDKGKEIVKRYRCDVCGTIERLVAYATPRAALRPLTDFDRKHFLHEDSVWYAQTWGQSRDWIAARFNDLRSKLGLDTTKQGS
jgi:WD40 repeat protein